MIGSVWEIDAWAPDTWADGAWGDAIAASTPPLSIELTDTRTGVPSFLVASKGSPAIADTRTGVPSFTVTSFSSPTIDIEV